MTCARCERAGGGAGGGAVGVAVGIAARVAVRALLVVALLAGAAQAVIIDAGDGSGNIDPPPAFPYWRNVDQRLGGTTVVYLGNGWVLTAGHVGPGSLLFGVERYEPDPDTVVRFRTVGEQGDATGEADLVAFRLAEGKPWPDVPLVEIAASPPLPGEEVLMIGNGRNRGERFRMQSDDGEESLGWRWGAGAKKRWGTNRIADAHEVIRHDETTTRAFGMRFDSVFDGGITPWEAQAATGDSGGAVFKHRDRDDPGSDWVLAGVMFTVHHPRGGPEEVSLYGDFTYAVDLTAYRDDLIATVRPACANEVDDDGDGLVDHPADPECESRLDDDERAPRGVFDARQARTRLIGIAAVAALGLGILTRALRRPR